LCLDRRGPQLLEDLLGLFLRDELRESIDLRRRELLEGEAGVGQDRRGLFRKPAVAERLDRGGAGHAHSSDGGSSSSTSTSSSEISTYMSFSVSPYQAFPAAHRMEKVFRRMEAALVRRFDEALRLRSEVSFLEVREGAVPIAAAEPLPADRLLADRSRHLGEVQHRAARPGARHDHRAVLDPEVFARDLSREVSRPAEDLHRLDLERLLEGPTRHLLELASLVRFDEALDLLDGGLQGIRDLLLRLLRDVLVVNPRREATDHDRADRHLRGLVDEDP